MNGVGIDRAMARARRVRVGVMEGEKSRRGVEVMRRGGVWRRREKKRVG
jgi:hypothetical protein